MENTREVDDVGREERRVNRYKVKSSSGSESD